MEAQSAAMLGMGSKSMPPGSGADMMPTGSAWTLLTAGPHSGAIFDIIGSRGIAITVIVCATVAMDRLPRLRRLAAPIIAVGTMSLTAYVGHFLVSSLVGRSAANGPAAHDSTGCHYSCSSSGLTSLVTLPEQLAPIGMRRLDHLHAGGLFVMADQPM